MFFYPGFLAASDTVNATIVIDAATRGGAAPARNGVVVGAEEPPYLQQERENKVATGSTAFSFCNLMMTSVDGERRGDGGQFGHLA